MLLDYPYPDRRQDLKNRSPNRDLLKYPLVVEGPKLGDLSP